MLPGCCYVDDGMGIYLALDVSTSDRVFLAFPKIPLSFLCDLRNRIVQNLFSAIQLLLISSSLPQSSNMSGRCNALTIW